MKNIFKNPIFMFILGALIFSSITVSAAYTLYANSVGYTPKASGWNVDNVGDAIDSLYIAKAGNNYSYDEKIVGKWVDGKDIYQRSFLVTETTNINGGSSHSANVPGFSSEFVSDVLPTLDTFIDIKVSGSVEAAGYDFPRNIRIVKSNGYIITYDNPGIEFVGYRFNKDSIITIQYTKNI